MVFKKDKKKIAIAVGCMLVWLIIIFGFGGLIKDTKVAEPKNLVKEDSIGLDIPEEKKTEEQKQNSAKLATINNQGIKKDAGIAANTLKISDWENPTTTTRNGITSMKVYFPAGQQASAWKESFVLRSFVNITLENPCPTVYQVYEKWVKEQVPNLKMNSMQDDTGVYFNGSNDKLFITGKVYNGSLKQTVHIAQYVIKSDGTEDTNTKANTWKANFAVLK